MIRNEYVRTQRVRPWVVASLGGRLAAGNRWWRHAALWLPPLLYMVVIFHLSAESDPVPVLTQNLWDKALHVIEYGVLASLVCRALRGEALGWTAALTLAFVVTSAYGASDEWHQLYTVGRNADLHDWMADTLGAAMGLATFVLLARTGLMTRTLPND
jgi:VanZ family protein